MMLSLNTDAISIVAVDYKLYCNRKWLVVRELGCQKGKTEEMNELSYIQSDLL
jgi:hypothetical protein